MYVGQPLFMTQSTLRALSWPKMNENFDNVITCRLLCLDYVLT